MQTCLDLIGDIVQFSLLGTFVVYVPLAKTFWRAALTIFLIAVLWASIRLAAQIVYIQTEPDVPLFGFVVFPLFSTIAAMIFRGLVDLVLQLPLFSRLRASIR
jgi:hypothetical protein